MYRMFDIEMGFNSMSSIVIIVGLWVYFILFIVIERYLSMYFSESNNFDYSG